MLDRWTKAAELALVAFEDSRKACNDVTIVESPDGSKTITKRARGGSGDASLLKLHVECLREVERLQHVPPVETEDDDEPQEPPRESEDWRALLNERNRDESETV